MVEQTSKIRIVFDASCRSSSDVSLNASSGTDRSTRFDLNFDTLPFFMSSPLTHKNVSADFSASIPNAPAENSGATISLLMSIRTNSLPSLTVQLLRHFWFRCLKHLAAHSSIYSKFSMRSSGFLCRWHAHWGGYSRIKTNSRWNHSAVKIRSIRVKQMGLELPWTGNGQSWPCANHYQR